MTDQDDQLRSLAKWLQPRQPKAPARLGDVILEYFKNELEPKQQQNTTIEQAWSMVVPEAFASHCRCDGIKAGQVRVTVDSSVYMYQLTIRNEELLEQLKQIAPRAKVKVLKLSVGSIKKR